MSQEFWRQSQVCVCGAIDGFVCVCVSVCGETGVCVWVCVCVEGETDLCVCLCAETMACVEEGLGLWRKSQESLWKENQEYVDRDLQCGKGEKDVWMFYVWSNRVGVETKL